MTRGRGRATTTTTTTKAALRAVRALTAPALGVEALALSLEMTSRT
jgi:hypothetical protein